MNCSEFEDLLQQQLDHGAAWDLVELSGHALHCAACRGLQEQMRTLSEAISLSNAALPGIDLADAILAAQAASLHAPVRAAPESSPFAHVHPTADAVPRAVRPLFWNIVTRTSSTASRRALACGIAALVVCALLLPEMLSLPQIPRDGALTALRVGQHDPSRKTVVAALDPQMEQGGAGAELEVEHLVAQAGSAYAALAWQAAGAIDDAAALVRPPVRTEPPMETRDVGTLVSREGVWMENVKSTLQPLGADLVSAFEFLWPVPGEPDDNPAT